MGSPFRLARIYYKIVFIDLQTRKAKNYSPKELLKSSGLFIVQKTKISPTAGCV